jgi:aspartate beta-hydroxylase
MRQPWVSVGPDHLAGWIDEQGVDRSAIARLLEGLDITARGDISNFAPPGQLPTVFVPGLSATPWWDRDAFSWLAGLEDAAIDIAGEFEALGGVAGGRVLRSNPTEIADSGRWSAQYLYNAGRAQHNNLRACPITVAALEPIPGALGCGMCYFSIADPHTHIASHTGYTNAHLRCHLSLIVPEGCAIRVGDETREWAPGKAFVFDDSFEHEVWNNGDSARAVLLFDIWHPELSEVERAALTYLMSVWRKRIYREFWSREMTVQVDG